MENKKKHQFLVGIPTLNRVKLLNESLPKYFEDFYKNDIIIVDNGNQNILKKQDRFDIIRPNENLGLCESWNVIIEKAIQLGYQRVIILNDKIYLGKNRKEIEGLIEKFYHGDIIYSPENFSAFIISTFSYQMYGGFDEKFYQKYFLISDYLYRLKIEGGYSIESEQLNPEVNKIANWQDVLHESLEDNKTHELTMWDNNESLENEKLYILKWGGLPNQEIFKKPYNE